ncbi:MAG: redox-regulated ATPase YchF [Microgenomates group bacterium]
MKLSCGIIGLPNVGKSTLFNALLKKQVAYAANYPFATIEPNVGIVEVPDDRLAALATVFPNNPPLVPAVVEFYDIAGLVAGASKGEGLGNKFLSHIREVEAIVHVVRIFEDSTITHVSDKIDPSSDIVTINTELILADLATLEKYKEPKGNAAKEDLATFEVVKKLRTALDAGTSARNVELDDDEKDAIKQLNLLSMKPVLFVFNTSEGQLEDKEGTEIKIAEILKQVQDDKGSSEYLYLCAKLENDIVELAPEEQKEYLNQYGLQETGLNRLIQKTYELLGLISFLTAGEKEVRAWTIRRGANAVQASGEIHTDFMKNFIKAEISSFADFVALKGWVGAREKGKVTLAGKDYIMKDGDVVEFKIGV